MVDQTLLSSSFQDVETVSEKLTYLAKAYTTRKFLKIPKRCPFNWYTLKRANKLVTLCHNTDSTETHATMTFLDPVATEQEIQ